MHEECPDWVNKASNRYIADCVRDGSSVYTKCLNELLWSTYWVLYSESAIQGIKVVREKILFESNSPKRYTTEALDFVIKITADLLDIHGAPTVETLGDIFLDKNVRYVSPKGSIDEDIGGKVYEIYLQALRGDKNACRYLSNCYREGKGVQQNAEKAQYWEMKATCEKNIADQSKKAEDDVEPRDPEAQYSLGRCYYYSTSLLFVSRGKIKARFTHFFSHKTSS